MQSYSNDQLSKVSDEELRKEYLSVRSVINVEKRNRGETLDLEIYFCYISKEIQEREHRGVKNNKKRATR